MSNYSPFTTFDLKRKKLQLVAIALLIILLPLLLYVLQTALSFRGRAAGETRLMLIPKNIAQSPDGTWKFTRGQEVEVDVVLDSGSNQIESIEPVIFYDKDSISLKDIDPGRLSTQNIFCNDFTPIKHKVAAVIGGLTVNQNGIEQGTELGFASIACTIYPSSNPDTAQIPPPAGFVAPVATFKFIPKKVGTGKTITFDFTAGGTNDSSAYKYEGGCCSKSNVLQLVENLTYDVVETQQDATLAFSPSSGSFTIGEQFQVQINLSTGIHTVDSVDAIINYNPQDLEVINVEEGVIFPTYTQSPRPGGTIDISAQINPASSQGLRGNNQLFATITFKALRPTPSSGLTFFVNPQDNHNDTNIVQFRQGVDILASVTNANFLIRAVTTPTPTTPPSSPTPNPFPAELLLTPANGNRPLGQPFTVAVILTTGTERVDSVDAIISYDRRYLQIVNITQNSAFESESNQQSDPNNTDHIRTVTLIHQVSPDSVGVTGTNLPLGTITFQPLRVTDQTPVNIVFTGAGDRNDSNVVKFKSSTDLLGKFTLGNFGIVGSMNNLVERIGFKIALQGRPESNKSKMKELVIKIIGTHFEQNPLTSATNTTGEVELSAELENRITMGEYVMLVKPKGYLQQRITTNLSNARNSIDLTNKPFKSGDLDNSGLINSFDWTKFLVAFNTTDPIADIDGTGLVNSLDNTYILLNWFGEDEF